MSDPRNWRLGMSLRIALVGTAAAVLAAFASGIGSAPVVADPADPGSSASGDVASAEAIARDQVRDVADSLAQASLAGYGRTTISFDTNTVTLAWKGKPPASILAAESLAKDVHVVTVSVPYSEADLIDVGRRLIEAGRSTDAVPVVEVEPNAAMDGVIAHVDQTALAKRPALASLEAPDMTATLSKFAGVPVQVDVGDPVVEQTRANDSAPWQGGARIYVPAAGNYCTTGFTAVTSSGAGRLLSAGHCDPGGGDAVQDGAGTQIAPGSGVQVWAAEDGLLIDPSASPATIAQVYRGAFNQASGTAAYESDVGGSAWPSVNDTVCVSGMNTGERCNRDVTATGITFSCYNGSRVCDGFSYSGTGQTTADGDSGAPVYIERSDGRVGARGIHIAGSGPVTCITNMWVQQGCTHVGYAVAAQRYADHWNLTIETR